MWMVFLGFIAFLAFLSIVLPSFWGGAWSPTPMHRVKEMLTMAGLQPGETLFDLGAGDGRVIIQAASLFPIKAVGIDIDPIKCALLRMRVKLKLMSDRITVLQGDFFSTDLSTADVVFLYLSPVAHDRLAEKLSRELRPGARVVCYRRTMPGMILERVNQEQNLYLYRILDVADPATMAS